MKYINKALSCIITFFSALSLIAQSECQRPERHDVGIISGTTFYMGDMSDNYSYFRNLSLCGGLIYRYNFNEYYALRGQICYGNLRGDVTRPDLPTNYDGRPLAFSRPIFMSDISAEVGFLPFNVINLYKNNLLSPYLIGGIGMVSLLPDKNIFHSTEDEVSSTTICILLGVGVKWAAAKRLSVGVEWIMRKTFSDQIDYFLGQPSSLLMNKDWMGGLGVTITYRLIGNNLCAAYQKNSTQTRHLTGKTL